MSLDSLALLVSGLVFVFGSFLLAENNKALTSALLASHLKLLIYSTFIS